MPSVTRLTDMNEYVNASNPDQPLTRPVAFLRNSDGAAVEPGTDAMLPSSRRTLGTRQPLISR